MHAQCSAREPTDAVGGSGAAGHHHHHHYREVYTGLYSDEDVLLSPQLLAYLSKYPHCRQVFYKPRPSFHPATAAQLSEGRPAPATSTSSGSSSRAHAGSGASNTSSSGFGRDINPFVKVFSSFAPTRQCNAVSA